MSSWKAVYALSNSLLALRNSTLDDEGIRNYLVHLRNQYSDLRVPDE